MIAEAGPSGGVPRPAVAPPTARPAPPATPPTAPAARLAAPPAGVPLGFLAASGAALVAFGVAVALAARTLVDTPMLPRAVATVHLGLLAFLTVAVLGAAHQFAPVVGGRALRSPRVAFATLALFVPAAWLLPFAFATDHPALVEVAGATATVAICLAAWNLSAPLLRRHADTPVVGLRIAIAFLVVTALFGATYAFDLHHGWFVLMPRRVLTHAHLGLFGWVGLAYVAVAEKLWPMFLLAHPRWTAPGQWAVRLVAAGAAVLATGLMLPVAAVAWTGGVLLGAGLVAHLVSFASVVRHRRRAVELLHAFVVASAVFLVVAMVAAVVAAVAPIGPDTRTRVVSVEIGSAAMWLALAVVGHVHKVVPFIAWGRLRERGVTTTPDGKPLLFAHLFDARVARATFAAAVIGAAALVGGLASRAPELVRLAGVALAVTGALATTNLVAGPLRVVRASRRPADPTPHAVKPVAATARAS